MAITFQRVGSNVLVTTGNRVISLPSSAVIKPHPQLQDQILISDKFNDYDADDGVMIDIDNVTGITFTTRNELITKLATDFFFSPLVINEVGGIMIQLINKTGAPSVKGELLSAHTIDNAVRKCPADSDSPIGVFFTSGVADGQLAWVVIGGVADVMLVTNNACAPGHHLFAGNVDGRVGATPNVNTSRHWGEVGHALQTKAGGTNVLVRCVLHWN
jgi:hypothetical protein